MYAASFLQSEKYEVPVQTLQSKLLGNRLQKEKWSSDNTVGNTISALNAQTIHKTEKGQIMWEYFSFWI